MFTFVWFSFEPPVDLGVGSDGVVIEPEQSEASERAEDERPARGLYDTSWILGLDGEIAAYYVPKTTEDNEKANGFGAGGAVHLEKFIFKSSRKSARGVDFGLRLRLGAGTDDPSDAEGVDDARLGVARLVLQPQYGDLGITVRSTFLPRVTPRTSEFAAVSVGPYSDFRAYQVGQYSVGAEKDDLSVIAVDGGLAGRVMFFHPVLGSPIGLELRVGAVYRQLFANDAIGVAQGSLNTQRTKYGGISGELSVLLPGVALRGTMYGIDQNRADQVDDLSGLSIVLSADVAPSLTFRFGGNKPHGTASLVPPRPPV